MKRTVRWFIGVIALTAAALIVTQGFFADWGALRAQTPSPTPAATPSPTESPVPNPEASPASSPTPSPTVAPSPSPTPSSAESPVANPEAAPVPNPEAAPEAPATFAVPVLPLSAEAYKDPGDRFQIGMIEGYTQSMVAGIPLFESEDGEIAYTVALRPRANTATINEAALAQIAMDMLEGGEGFTPGAFEPVPAGGARIPWTGGLTIKGPPQPMQGLILSRQLSDRVLVLVISATEAGSENLEAVYSTLEPTLAVVEAEVNPA